MLASLEQPKKILVIGDLILDRYSSLSYTNTRENSKIYCVSEEGFYLGGVGNLVNQLLALKQEVTLISRLGQDLAGQTLWQLLIEKYPQQNGLHIYRDSQLRTTSKHYLDVGLRLDVDDQGLSLAFEEFLWQVVTSLDLRNFDAVIFSDYGKGIFDPSSQTIRHVQQLCQAYQLPIFVDSKQEELSLFRGCQLIKSNRVECCRQAGLTTNYPASTDLQVLANRYQVKDWIVTLDQDGVCALLDGQYLTYPSLVAHLVNPVGAGDSFLAYYVVACLTGQASDVALKLASAAAAVQAEHRETYTVTLEEVTKIVCRDKWNG